MPTLGRKTIATPLAVMLLCTLCAGRLSADGDGKSEAAKARPPKIEAPAPLTERERLLLDRMEQLEQRVAELEAKHNASVPSVSAAGAAARLAAPSVATGQPAAFVARSDASASASDVSVVQPNGGAAPASTTVASANTAAIGPPQATEKGKSGASKPQTAEPFAFADFTWLNGNARTKDTPYATSFFTPEIRADVDYNYSFNHPKDDTIGGSSEVFRHGEVQVTQLGVGGDFHYDNVRARLMTQFGMYSQTTPRNDASVAHGQWNLDNAYRYVSEAYGGYHFNALHGINLDAGIFVSYIGLFSYYNFDNWAYQPSYVSSNTPWFFNGVRLQVFPTAKLKIEPWFINGWQSYGKFNKKPGLGGQINYRPNGRVSIILNNYGLGTDALGVPNRTRFHTDDSIEVKYYDNPGRLLDKAAFTFTGDLGCESGGGVSCFGNTVKVVGGQRIVNPK